MGCTIKPITFIGKSFKNETEAFAYFQSKIPMTEDDLDEMGPHLKYWLESRQTKGFPTCGNYSDFAGDENCGFYIGYDVFDSNPEKMIMKIQKAATLWQDLFKDKPQLLNEVLYT